MSRALRRLLAAFGHALPEERHRNVRDVLAGLERADRVIDACSDATARVAVAEAIVRAVRGPETGAPVDPGREGAPELAERPADPGSPGVLDADLRGPFESWRLVFPDVEETCGAMLRCFEQGERARRARHRDAFVRAVRSEGRAFAQIFLPLLEEHTEAAFREFFLDLGETANLLDKLVDARVDRIRGELPLRPGLRHHLRLVGEIVRDASGLLRRAPDRVKFARWAWWFLLPHHHDSARRRARRPAVHGSRRDPGGPSSGRSLLLADDVEGSGGA